MNKLIKAYILAASFILGSCGDDLDINVDPNNPANSTPQLTLPAAQVGLAVQLESHYNILGSILAHYWTQGPTASQYSGIEQYNITTTSYANAWTALYAGNAGVGFDTGVLSDLEFVKTSALENNIPNYAAVAQLLQAYTYQLLVDLYDKVPYSEALKGRQGIIAPKFDNGEDIYSDLIVRIDEALALIDETTPVPGAEDLVFGGDMDLWRKFGNTLKLKIYIRQAFARPDVAQAGIQSLYATNAEFLDAGEDARVSFSENTGNENPLWQELNATTPQNVVASQTSTSILSENNDERITAFYDVSPITTAYTGLVQGTGTSASGVVYNNFARPDAEIILNRSAPVYFMTGYESLFMQAEAAQRGWGGSDPKSLYDEAVIASFAFWGLEGTSTVAEGGVYEYDNQLETIYLQKWIAFNGEQGYEGWTEWRRTGVPALERSVTGQPLANNFPLRLIWPTNETSSNPNAPTLTTVDTPVWWDETF